MSGRFSISPWVPALLALGLLLAVLDGTPPVAALESVRETQELLRGTWLREYAEDGTQVRRLLTLDPDGRFREEVRVVDGNGRETAFAHAGTWLFDGVNLKRKYTSMNGQPPSRLNLPFATFQLEFESRNEFVGVDHIHRNRVRYRRLAS